jgi:hypothetical protein
VGRSEEKEKRRPKGDGGLFKRAGCRFWYAQYVQDGKKVRVSTRETSKMAALGALRRLMGDAERGLAPLPQARKLRYADLRQGLLDDYRRKKNRSLTTDANGDETIHALYALDEFFGYGPKNPDRESQKSDRKHRVTSSVSGKIRALAMRLSIAAWHVCAVCCGLLATMMK